MKNNSEANSQGARRRLSLLTAGIALCSLTGTGCQLADTGPSPHLPPDQFFATFALTHRAINLSTVTPYDTVTLQTTRAMGDGSAVPGEVVYSVNSPSLSITNGVLKATGAVTEAVVYATLTYGTVTRTDSAVVSVMVGAPELLRDFGFQIPAGDSAKTGMPVGKTIPLRRASHTGSTLSALLISLVSSDTTTASIAQWDDEVYVKPKRPGRVVLIASTFAYGTAWRDSLVFTVGWPLWFFAQVRDRVQSGSAASVLDFAFPEFTIGTGSCVIWVNKNDSVDIDLQFEDPAHVSAADAAHADSPCAFLPPDPTVGGHIGPFHTIPWDGNPEHYFESFQSSHRARVFSAPGVFAYRSSLHGTTGLVRVCDERNDTTCAPRGLGAW